MSPRHQEVRRVANYLLRQNDDCCCSPMQMHHPRECDAFAKRVVEIVNDERDESDPLFATTEIVREVLR